jgi:hypothetical protein
MTPLIKELVKLVSSVDIDPTEMHWFDVTGAIKEYIGYDQRKYLLHPAPYKNMMICGRTKTGDFMLSVLADGAVTIVTGWILKPAGYTKLGSFTLVDNNGEPLVGVAYEPIDEKDRAMMCGILAMFYASLDMKVQAYVPTPHQANVSRAKRGLKPLYDWHTVVIEPPKPTQDSQGGTHASPRRHQARGHWRTYASGKRGWVKECWRGDASKGTIFKDYQIKERGL